MHSKSMIIDDKFLIIGSMNFSYNGENKNDENTLVLQKEEVDDIKWMSSKEVDQLYKNNKFKKTHYKYFTKLKSIIKNN